MKLAIVSDIHGNIDAFEKFIKVINHNNVSMILNLGDYVRGQNPNKIMEYIMKDDRFISIIGNHEEGYCYECEKSEKERENLYIEWIKAQEKKKIVDIDGFKILMVHSRIESNKLAPLLYNGYNLDEFMADYPDDVDLICFGHTHIQLFIENFYGKRILNPGSLGLAIDGKINFAIIEIENEELKCKFYKLN